MGAGTAIPYVRGGVRFIIGVAGQLQIPPRIFRLRLTGMLFDTDKSFLLSSAMRGIKMLKRFYDEHPGLEVLVTGHTDTMGPPQYNLDLSVDRALAVAAFLKDRVDVWLDWYQPSHPFAKRWGTLEDRRMLAHLVDANGQPFYTGPLDSSGPGPRTRTAITNFQQFANDNRSAGLTVNGTADEPTRRALIREYMAEDDTTLADPTEPVTHGCGFFNPEIPTGPNVPEQRNRRVEIFLFEGPITPPPRSPCAAPGCPELQIWKTGASLTIDLEKEPGTLRVLVRTGAGGVPGAVVTATGPERRTAAANDEGDALFELTVPGTYTIEAQAAGFESVSGPRVVHVPEGGEATDIIIMEELTGTLRVKVLHLTNDIPIPGAVVTATGPTTRTDTAGTTGLAVMSNLRIGEYEITATSPGLQQEAPVRVVLQRDDDRLVIVRLFEEQSFKLFSYNLFFLPQLITDSQQMRRASLMPPHLAGSDAIIFSEAFDNDARERLLQGIASTYPFHTQVVDAFGALEDGGVLIASKWPIEVEDQRVFPDTAGTDGFSAKGVVYARINKQGKRYHVFGSHTQAHDEPDVRHRQFQTIFGFVLSKGIPPFEPVLIGGDLNVNRFAAGEFSRMLQTLDSRFVTTPQGHRFTYDANRNLLTVETGQEYLDYVLVFRRNLQARDYVVTTVEVQTAQPWKTRDDGRPVRDLSDHYAVRGDLTFRF